MSSDGSAPRVDIAHVLYIDLVGYSRKLMEQQLGLIRELQEIVRATKAFRRASEANSLISLPTGDGIALAFFDSPTEPAECAVEIAESVATLDYIQLRMGIHSGPVYRVEDINLNLNVSGGGINIAQRVMDCGDDGHILVSRTVADVLAQLSRWTNHLEDLGEVAVKHDFVVHLFNLHSDEYGNMATPAKLLDRDLPAVVDVGRGTGPRAMSPTTDSSEAQIALLYRRGGEQDERLLHLLEERIKADGYRVFIDRHMSVGMAWAAEIERQIRASDDVIVLVSEHAMHSEMLTMEVHIAHEAAQQQEGRPRLLPIRIGWEGPLPQELADILDPIQYALWTSEEDNERLVDEVITALDSDHANSGFPLRIAAAPSAEPHPTQESEQSTLRPAGGAMPPDSPLYVERDTDEEFYAALGRRDSIVLIKGARQMGKTSLLARGLQRARESNAQTVRTDFQKFSASQLESPEELYMAIADSLADQLDLDTYIDEAWRDRSGPSTNFERYIRRHVLGKTNQYVVWGMDEVDILFNCAFASEVFALFRTWHNERSLDPTGPWTRVTLAIAYATEAHLFITDVNQSPFNVGTRLELSDFTFEQVADFNRRMGSPLDSEGDVARYMRLVGGSPYLVHRGLQEMVSRDVDVTTLEAGAGREGGIYGDHLRRILVLLARDEELTASVRGLLRGQMISDPHHFYRLNRAGLVTGDSPRDARPRCQLYASYLERHLL